MNKQEFERLFNDIKVYWQVDQDQEAVSKSAKLFWDQWQHEKAVIVSEAITRAAGSTSHGYGKFPLPGLFTPFITAIKNRERESYQGMVESCSPRVARFNRVLAMHGLSLWAGNSHAELTLMPKKQRNAVKVAVLWILENRKYLSDDEYTAAVERALSYLKGCHKEAGNAVHEMLNKIWQGEIKEFTVIRNDKRETIKVEEI